MSASDTPRTDAKSFHRRYAPIGPGSEVCLADFARTLEREVADREAAIARLEVALIEAAESFNKISGAAIKGDSKTAMALAIGALETARAILAKMVQP